MTFLARILLVTSLAGAATAQTEPERLIAAGHWKRARALVEAHIAESPDDPLANFLLSQIRNAFGDHESPLPLAEKAVALNGTVAKFHRQVAECLGVMAQHSNVFQQVLLARRFRKEIDTALTLDPQDTQALSDLMEFYLLAPGIIGGDLSKASQTARRLATIEPIEGLLAQARIAMFRKQPREAEDLLRRAVGVQPPSYKAWVSLAHYYLSINPANFEAARKAADAALELDRARVDAYAVLAEVHAACAEWTELEDLLLSASWKVPDDLTPYYRAAERLFAMGREQERAKRYLQTYVTKPAEGNAPSIAEARARLNERTGARGNSYIEESQDIRQVRLRLAEDPL